MATTAIALVAAQVGLSVQSANRRRHCWRPRSPQPRLRPVEPPTRRTAPRAMGRTSTTEHSGRPFADPSSARHGSGALRISSSPSSKPCLRRRRRSLGAGRTAEVLAYLMSQNQLVAADKPVSSNLDELKGMLLPGATGGPSGGLTGGVALPPAPRKANPLDRLTPVTDALLANPPAGEWLTWRRGSDGVGFSPLRQVTKTERGRAPHGMELVVARTARTKARRSFTTACCSFTPTATRSRRSTLSRATCCGSTPAVCRWGHAKREAIDRPLRGQGLHGHVRCTSRGARRKDGARGLGQGSRGSYEGVQPYRWRDSGQRQSDRQHHRPQQRRQFHRGPRCQHGGRGVALQHHPEGERTRRQHLERCAL